METPAPKKTVVFDVETPEMPVQTSLAQLALYRTPQTDSTSDSDADRISTSSVSVSDEEGVSYGAVEPTPKTRIKLSHFDAKARVKEANEQAATAKERVAELESTETKLRALLASKETELAGLKTEKQHLLRENDKVRAELKRIEARVLGLEETVSSKEIELARLDADKTRLSVENNELQAELARVTEENASFTAQLEAQHRQEEELAEQLEQPEPFPVVRIPVDEDHKERIVQNVNGADWTDYNRQLESLICHELGAIVWDEETFSCTSKLPFAARSFGNTLIFHAADMQERVGWPGKPVYSSLLLALWRRFEIVDVSEGTCDDRKKRKGVKVRLVRPSQLAEE